MSEFPSFLDPGQIIQRSYDEDENRIRVDAEVTANISGPQEVLINQADDSVAIGNGTTLYTGTQVGGHFALDVNVVQEGPSLNQTVRLIYGEVLAVASGISTQIVSYTVPVGKTAILQSVMTSGENIAAYTLQDNSSTIAMRRTYFGGELNTDFIFANENATGYLLNAGDTITMSVLHNRPDTANFESTIQVVEIS